MCVDFAKVVLRMRHHTNLQTLAHHTNLARAEMRAAGVGSRGTTVARHSQIYSRLMMCLEKLWRARAPVVSNFGCRETVDTQAAADALGAPSRADARALVCLRATRIRDERADDQTRLAGHSSIRSHCPECGLAR